MQLLINSIILLDKNLDESAEVTTEIFLICIKFCKKKKGLQQLEAQISAVKSLKNYRINCNIRFKVIESSYYELKWQEKH